MGGSRRTCTPPAQLKWLQPSARKAIDTPCCTLISPGKAWLMACSFYLVACRPEDAIRTYFKTGGKVAPAPVHPRIPAPDAATFAKWFPGLELSKTACAQPRQASYQISALFVLVFFCLPGDRPVIPSSSCVLPSSAPPAESLLRAPQMVPP